MLMVSTRGLCYMLSVKLKSENKSLSVVIPVSERVRYPYPGTITDIILDVLSLRYKQGVLSECVRQLGCKCLPIMYIGGNILLLVSELEHTGKFQQTIVYTQMTGLGAMTKDLHVY